MDIGISIGEIGQSGVINCCFFFGMLFNEVKLVAFDADDTLWDCQSHFNSVEDRYFELLSPYGTREYLYDHFFSTETQNMASMGYGSKAFTISLVENALRVSGGSISTSKIAEIISLGKSLLEMPTIPLTDVVETLTQLHYIAEKNNSFRIIVFTKGEIIEQENKLKRSGLSSFFSDVEIVSDKTEAAYHKLCRLHGVRPNELLMIGNSFKSDIAPAIAIGAFAIYVPYHIVWKMEHTEEFEHPNLIKVSRIIDIIKYFT